MDEAEAEASEPAELDGPSEPVVIKKRGRPKGSLNKKTIAKMREDVLPEDGPESSILEREDTLPPMVLDIDFTSDETLGEKPRATPKRKPKAAPKARDPPTEPPSEDESPPPPPPPRNKKRPPRVRNTERHISRRASTCDSQPALLPGDSNTRPEGGTCKAVRREGCTV